jgi:hypothetical protein
VSRGLRALTRERVITLVVVGGSVLFVLWQLRPDLLFSNSTPAGGDMGGWVWAPRFMREHLLPQGRITGWTMDWHAGLAAFVFYFPLPFVAIAVVSMVLPYGLTFKLLSALAVLALPVVAWAFGRLASLRFPTPELMSVASVAFLLDHFMPRARGGDLISTVRGEIAYSYALVLALLFLALLARGLASNRHRAVAAVVLGLTVLSHVFGLLFALAGAAALVAVRRRRAGLVHAGLVVVTGLLLAAFWLVPLQLRYSLVPPTGNPPSAFHVTYLFPFVDTCTSPIKCGQGQFLFYQVWHLFPVTALAVFGVVLAVRRREPVPIALALVASVMALAYALKPVARLQNDRFLPFWFLCLYLLAAYGLAELARFVHNFLVRRRRRDARAREREPVFLGAVPVVTLLLVTWLVGIPYIDPPGGLPLHVSDRTGMQGYVRVAYAGYEGARGADEYRELMDTLDEIGRTRGCGRFMGEADPRPMDTYGSYNALLLVPYWTDGCIQTLNEGLEVSATAPYEQLIKEELSYVPIANLPGNPRATIDAPRRIDHLRLLGARYYAAWSDEAKQRADAAEGLERIADVGNWRIYQLDRTELVAPLRFLPAVVKDVGKPGRTWDAIGMDHFQREPSVWEVPLAASGPSDWPRVVPRRRPGVRSKNVTAFGGPGGTAPTFVATKGPVVLGSTVDVVGAPRRPVTPARVSKVKIDDDSISFDVDRTGSPVLVKVSYFPNWKVSGARGPWRATPNFMVVVPTEKHVSLRYSWTPVDLTGAGLSLIGVAAVGGLAWLDRHSPAPEPVPVEPVAPARPARPTRAVPTPTRSRNRSRSRGRSRR